MSKSNGTNWPFSPFSSSGATNVCPGWSSTRKMDRVLTSTRTLSLFAKGCFAGVREGFFSPLPLGLHPDRWGQEGFEEQPFLSGCYFQLDAWLETHLHSLFEGD